MTKYIFCAYLLISCFTTVAQPNRGQLIYNQFEKETRNLKEDTNKVLLYFKFAERLELLLPDTVLRMTKEAKALSRKLNYERGIELSIFREGMIAEDKRDYSLAITYYTAAAKIGELRKLNPDVFEIYNASLNVYYYQADYPKAMEIAQKGISLAERLKDQEDLAHYNNQAGFIYEKQDKAEASIKYNSQYLNLAYQINNQMMIADADNSLGDDYLLKHDYKTSLIYFFKALNIYDKMEGEERFDRERISFKPERIAYTLFKISTAYKLAGNYQQALKYSLIIIDEYDKRKGIGIFNNYDLASYFINTGDIYRLLNDYKHAGPLLNKGLKIAKSIFHREDICDAYEGLSKNFAVQKRYDSAYYYHILFTQLKDSIINQKVSREINNLEVQRRDKEIALLNQQRKLKEAEAARQDIKRTFIIEFATLIVVIAFLLLYIQNRIKQQKLVFEKQLAVQVERRRISSDMHDDIGTGLSTMLIYINMMKLKLAGTNDGPNIERIANLGTGLVDHMKEIVWSLSPGNDRLDSLLIFMRQYFVLLFEPLPYTTNIVFPLTIPDIELDGELRRNIFLCFKESLNNVIKHANASTVELHVQIMQNTLVIQVKDNGIGISIPPEEKTTGNGLKNISQRMSAIKGKFNISNNNGAVIRLEVDFPNYPNG
jgi:two-component system NarL family sensor kinase